MGGNKHSDKTNGTGKTSTVYKAVRDIPIKQKRRYGKKAYGDNGSSSYVHRSSYHKNW